MSYQVLARKWRPKSFPELVGQEHVKSTLINALNLGRLHHAYLFTGTRGVGKTTIARIFAKSLNCDQGVTANPCGQCDACMTIEQGHFVDLIEIDAASRTKVEDTREILDNVLYAPSRGRYKVYLIDEVHMLSRNSFNALLKTLEEPPAHVKFLLATTEPQKLPVTILSRCLQFNLKALSRIEIASHLEHILSAESIPFDEDSLKLLAKAADGSLRDALSLTDQAIAQTNGGLTMVDVQQMLGTIDKQWSLKLLAHIVNCNPEQALATVEEIACFMPDYRNLTDDLLSIFHLAAMTQLVPQAAQVSENQKEFILALAKKLTPQDVQLYYQLLLNGKKDLELAPDPRMGFEMMLLRLLAFNPVAVNDQLPVMTTAQLASGRPAAQATAQLQVPAAPSHSPSSSQSPSHSIVSEPKKKLLTEVVAEKAVQSAQLSQPTQPMMPVAPQANPNQQVTREVLELEQQSVLQMADGLGFDPVADSAAVEAKVEAQVEAKVEAQVEVKVETTAAPKPASQREPQSPLQQIKSPLFESLASQKIVEPAVDTPATSAETQAQTSAAPPQLQPQTPEAQSIPADDYPEDISFSAEDDDSDDSALAYSQYAAMDMGNAPTDNAPAAAKINKPSVIKPVATSADDGFEDPVAAILANRNLALDDMFQGKSDPEPAQKPVRKALAKPIEKPAPAPEQKATLEPAVEPVAKPVAKTQPEPMQTQARPESVTAPAPVASIVSPQPKAPEPEPEKAQPSEPVTAEPVAAEPINTSGIPRWSSEVDEWAALIEQMQLGGRERIVAVHSVWQKTDKVITLMVANAQKHLASEGVHGQLTKAMIRTLNQVIELEFTYTGEALQTPFAIQQDIDARRLAYAKESFYQDPLIEAMKSQFDAMVDDNSIQPIG